MRYASECVRDGAHNFCAANKIENENNIPYGNKRESNEKLLLNRNSQYLANFLSLSATQTEHTHTHHIDRIPIDPYSAARHLSARLLR